MAKGGPQPGSGRPRKALSYLRELAEARGVIAERANELFDAVMSLALGGDVQAARLVAEWTWGRVSHGPAPTQEEVQQYCELAGVERLDDVADTAEFREKILNRARFVLFVSMMRGNDTAAREFMNRYEGMPVQTIREQIAEMPPEDAAAHFRAHARQCGASDEVIDKMLGGGESA